MSSESLSTSLDSIPLELLENIISFISEQKSLASCALVCKRWVPASRATLFSSLSLPNDIRTRSFLNLLDNETPSTLIYARIKHLHLSSSSRFDVGSDSERVITSWGARTPKTHEALHAVFGHLNSMSVRFISSWVTPERPEDVWYSTITSLRLEYVNFDDQEELHKLMKSCPALESLELSSIEVMQVQQEERETIEIESQPRLKSLLISYIHDPATLALLAPFCDSLQKFEYDWHSQQYSSARSLPGVGAILRAAQGTLEEISLKTGSWAEIVSFNEGINKLFEANLELARLSSLRRLALDISTIYLLPILRRLASAYDAQNRESPDPETQSHTGPPPSITHLYIPAIGYKSSFQSSNSNHSPNPPPPDVLPFLINANTNVQPESRSDSAPVFQGLNKNLHQALESLLPIHPVFSDLVEVRCDADDIYNAADFAVAASSQFFQSQYYMRLSKESQSESPSGSGSGSGTARPSSSLSSTSPRPARRNSPQPQLYSSFVPYRRTDTTIALSAADAEASEEDDLETLAPSQFSLGEGSLHRFPRPGTVSHSRLRQHIRKLRKHMPICAAKGIAPIPVVRYWFNDVPTGLVAEERMWAAGDGYAAGGGQHGGGGGTWEEDGDVGGAGGAGEDGVEDDLDAEHIGGMQGLSMRGMELWDSGRGKVLFGVGCLVFGVYWWL